jgi:hypothetical protein
MIDPGDSIVGEVKAELLREIDAGGHGCRHCQDRQDRCGQLKFQFLQHGLTLAERHNTKRAFGSTLGASPVFPFISSE